MLAGGWRGHTLDLSLVATALLSALRFRAFVASGTVDFPLIFLSFGVLLLLGLASMLHQC